MYPIIYALFSPAHSMILNPNDPIWVNHFCLEDLQEIKDHVDHSLNNDLPEELMDILLLLNQKVKFEFSLCLTSFSFRTIYDAMDTVSVDPVYF